MNISLTPPATPQKKTSIIIESGIIDSLTTMIDLKGHDRVAVLFDAGIQAIANRLKKGLPEAVFLSVTSGDSSKSLAEADRIVSSMLDAGCTKNTLLLCVGGGMLTDLGGFVASIFMRGIRCVLIPTTLLGMVDASIGGKTAVNAGGRKNMIGTITHPSSILIDLDLLQTLPAPQLAEGLVEVIKIAAMVDQPFFEWLEENLGIILKRDKDMLAECVERAVQAKVKVVEADDHDRDVRLLLNFGHTVGHAIEALSGYTLSHGAAVAIGMAAEMEILGFKDAMRVNALLTKLGLSLKIPPTMTSESLWQAMQSDKKNEGGKVRYAAPTHLGEGSVHLLTQQQFLSLKR